MTSLSAEAIGFAPPGAGEVLHDITLEAKSGEVLGLLGPNGAGKSSLLRLFYGGGRPSRGAARIDGIDLHCLPASARARLVAAVPQESPPDFHLRVREVVETGRTPHSGGLLRRDPGGPAAVDRALDRLGLSGLADRDFTTLSGGEKKRVLIARALAQEARVLILDEPVNHLDIRHRLEVMALLRRLGATVLVSLHDLDLAARFCDRLAVLHRGRLFAQGRPREVLRPRLIREVFGVDATIARGVEVEVSLRLPRTPLPAKDDTTWTSATSS